MCIEAGYRSSIQVIVVWVTDDDGINSGQLWTRGHQNWHVKKKLNVWLVLVLVCFSTQKQTTKIPNLFHSAGGPSVPFGPSKLDRRCPLAEDGVSKNIQSVNFNQNCGMTQPGDSQTWIRVRQSLVLDKVGFQHWEFSIQRLEEEDGKLANVTFEIF